MGLQQRRDAARKLETELMRTKGMIVDYTPKKFRRRIYVTGICWLPTVEYRVNGETYRAPNRYYTDREQFPLGTEVDISYDLRDPTHFHLENDPAIHDPGGPAIRLGVIWIILCCVLTILLAVLLRHQGF